MSDDRRWHITVSVAAIGMLSLICFGIFAATGGLGPNKGQRLDRLEQQVKELQTQVRRLENRQ